MSAPSNPEPGTPKSEREFVSFDRIGKSFFGVPVLKDVTFNAGAGRITGLVGENGAGKSTLMNLLGGILRPDSGAIRVNGRDHTPRNPDEARAAGIAFVHQELNLFPNLSIAENLHLTAFPLSFGGFPWINRAALRRQSRELLNQVGLDLPPDTPVHRLSSGERQLVEIAKALGADARVLILDEPTTSLSIRECEHLFTLLPRLRERRLALIYISHALGDVLRLGDDLVVLRDGQIVGSGTREKFNHERLVSLMVGRQLNQLYPERRQPPVARSTSAEVQTQPAASIPILSVRSLSQPGVIRNISFEVHAGEILGLSGLMGAGRSELARILFGLDPHAEGDVRLHGEILAGSPRQRVRRGVGFLTEDRRAEGLCLEASVAENLALVTLPGAGRSPVRWLDFPAIRAGVRRVRDAVGLTSTLDDSQPVRTLSGGNQQKVVLGKWLLAEPRVFILDEPTRGIDVGARFEIYQLIQQLAGRGAGVLVISSEIEELIGLCDRILVMRLGELTAGFRRDEFDRERILAAALPPSRT